MACVLLQKRRSNRQAALLDAESPQTAREMTMTYICVKCQRTWILDEPTDYVSGGICRECITVYVHSKQVKAGNEACFGEPSLCNDADSCRYRQWCLTQ